MVRYVNKKKIGIMGGTFDPVHTGHLIIAEKAREEFSLEEILFIPTGIPPHKKEIFAEPFHRLEMVKLAIKGNRYFRADDIEIQRQKPSYTYDTIILMKSAYPESEFFFITGVDMFDELKTWHRYIELVKEVIFLVAPREMKEKILFSEIPFLRYELIHSPIIDISSSYIRSCLVEDKSVKYLVPDRVLKYIRGNKLYGTGRDKEKNKKCR